MEASNNNCPNDCPADRLQERMEAISKEIQELNRAVHETTSQVNELMVKMATYTTIVGQNINEQKTLNTHLMRIIDVHDERIRRLEQSKAVIDATLPEKFIDANELDQRLRAIEQSGKAQDAKIEELKTTIAKWYGGGIVLIFIAEMAMKFFWK